jgi:hypothetical protein
MKYVLIWLALCVGKSKPLLFFSTFHMKFYLISSCLISISQFALTQQYFVLAGVVLLLVFFVGRPLQFIQEEILFFWGAICKDTTVFL